jgi:hypothetical protein
MCSGYFTFYGTISASPRSLLRLILSIRAYSTAAPYCSSYCTLHCTALHYTTLHYTTLTLVLLTGVIIIVIIALLTLTERAGPVLIKPNATRDDGNKTPTTTTTTTLHGASYSYTVPQIGQTRPDQHCSQINTKHCNFKSKFKFQKGQVCSSVQ